MQGADLEVFDARADGGFEGSTFGFNAGLSVCDFECEGVPAHRTAVDGGRHERRAEREREARETRGVLTEPRDRQVLPSSEGSQVSKS